MAKYFKFPFGVGGDRGAIPETSPPDGSVSFTSGFGVNYQLDPGSDSDALDIPRLQFNQLIYDVTLALKQYQEHGFPDFITMSDNGGTPHEYGINDHVRYDDGTGMKCYYSLVDGNTDTPPSANWGIVVYSQGVAPGTTEIWPFLTIKDGGYVWLNGTTIGDGSSNATQRANADTSTIYAKIWADYGNAVCPIFTAGGVPSTRGISAAVDFAAHKQLALPDYCGRTLFGMDNMGGIAAKNRITVGISGISGTTLGSAGGAEGVQLTGNQNGSHTHVAGITDPGHDHPGSTATIADHHHNIASSTIAGNAGIALTSNNYLSQQRGPNNTQDYALVSAQNAVAPNLAITSDNGAQSPSVNVASHGTGLTVNNGNSGLGENHQNMPPAAIVGGFIMKL